MKDKIKIGERWVGDGQPTFIIAEAGSNHDRNLEQARRLIAAAAKSGADAVKFQLFTADDLYSPDSPVYAAVKSVELPPEWLPELARCASDQGIMFLASPFSRAAIDALDAVNAPAYKWASSETTKLDLLKYAAARRKPILLSTGMCDLADVHEAIEVIRSEGNPDIVLLQCSALYPAPPDQAHLRAMDTLRAAFQLPAGFSDHTLGIAIPVAAVARGACLVEKHLTLDRSLPGPDHGYAMEPAGFKSMVEAIRATEQALGSPVKTMLPDEGRYARRDSLRAARDIAAGETFTPEMVAVQRPGDGLRPRFVNAVMGRTARRSLAKGEALTWEDIG